MSVIETRDEINQVCDALYCDAMGERKYFYAVNNGPRNPTTTTIDEDKDQIAAWGNRVYIANQIAYILTYSHREDCNLMINLMDRDEWKNGGDLITNPARFYRVLESIRYNLYSNGGQVMLCREDMERLNDLIAVIARVIVGECQRGKGERVI